VSDILVIWESDPLCHLPTGDSELAARVAGELGHTFWLSPREGILVVNSPFARRQVALIVEDGGGRILGEALGELLLNTSARVNLVRWAGPDTPLPLGGHLLLWLAQAPENSPLTIIPGKYYGSARLASLLYEELYSASRLTPGTDILYLEGPRQACPCSLPAVVIECPPVPAGAALHLAAGLKRGLARHFSGEGTSRSGGSGRSAPEGDTSVQIFWQRLKEAVPAARLTAAARVIFPLADDPAPAIETSAPIAAPPRAAPKVMPQGRTLGSQRPGSLSSALSGRRPPVLPPPPVHGFRYPASPYPVSMAPFVRPASSAAVGLAETRPFTRPQLGISTATDQGPAPAAKEADGPCPPGSPLR